MRHQRVLVHFEDQHPTITISVYYFGGCCGLPFFWDLCILGMGGGCGVPFFRNLCILETGNCRPALSDLEIFLSPDLALPRPDIPDIHSTREGRGAFIKTGV